MSNIITFPPIDQLAKDEFGRIVFPTGYPVDLLPTDDDGIIIIPQGYPDWYEAAERNRKTYSSLLLNKVNKGVLQDFDFVLSPGLTTEYMCSYSKDEFGRVTFNLGIDSQETIESGKILLILMELAVPNKMGCRSWECAAPTLPGYPTSWI